MDKLCKLRNQIDQIDDELLKLFVKRLNVIKEIGEYKKANGIAVFDQKRETLLLARLKDRLNNDKLWSYYEKFITALLLISKEYQNE